MGLDIRLPIGMMFLLIGGLMAIYGLATGSDTAMYQASLSININLVWGGVLFLFGGVMFAFAMKDRVKNSK